MTLYVLYRTARLIALSLPIRASYALASLLADIYASFWPGERAAVAANIAAITGRKNNDPAVRTMSRRVFRNFGKYLVDFFRFERIDSAYIDTQVRVTGREHIDAALKLKKGVIFISAHIGNWELGGAVLTRIGYPVHAVVLTHASGRVNDFFQKQRMTGGVTPIEIGMTLKSCFRILRQNGCLALLADRDFTRARYTADFCGRKMRVPRGPAALSHRLGVPIVPSFLIREPDDTFTLAIEPAILPTDAGGEEAAVAAITSRCLAVIEAYVRRYPDQWYIFKNAWSLHD